MIGLVIVAVGGGLSYLLYRWRLGRLRAKTTGTGGKGVKSVAVRKQSRRLGYRYADDRIFIHHGGVFTGVILDGDTDEFATRGEVEELALRPVSVYHDLIGVFDGQAVDCHELVRYRPITTKEWLRQLLSHAWDPTDMFRILAGKVAEHITGSTPRRMWVIIVRLGDLCVGGAPDPLAGVAGDIVGVAEERFRREDLRPFWEKADTIRRAMAGHHGQPLTRQDLLWIIRKPLHGHLPVPDRPVTSRRPWRGGYFNLVANFHGENNQWNVALHQKDPDTDERRTSYTATLVVTGQKPRMLFNPGSAWASRLAELEHPVEISWRYRLLPAEQWKKLSGRVIADLKDEAVDREKAGAGEDLKFEAKLDQAIRVDTANETDPQPAMVGRLRFSVSAPTEKQLAEAVNAAQRALAQVDILVERPEWAQLLLLEEQLPGDPPTEHLGALSAGSVGGLRLWQRHTDTYLPAIGLLGSHNSVGDQVENFQGRALGWIGMPRGYLLSTGGVFYFDPHVQVARSSGAGVGIFGATGGGKSTLGLSLFFFDSESGVQCVALDPKDDFAAFVYYLSFGPQVLHPDFIAEAHAGTVGTPASRFQPVNPRFWADTEVVDLARGARGSLDPWRVTDDYLNANSLAGEVTDILFPSTDQQGIVKAALRRMMADRKQAQADGRPFTGSYGRVRDYVQAERNALTAERAQSGANFELRKEITTYDTVLARLEEAERAPFARLLFGRPEDNIAPLGRLSARRTVITMQGFTSPKNPHDHSKWSDPERNAGAAMHVILQRLETVFDGRYVPNPRTGRPARRPVEVLADEGYMFTANPASRSTSTRLMRQGRSLNAVFVFLSQQARDGEKLEEDNKAAGDTESNQFGTVCIFKQKSIKPEGVDALRLLRASAADIPAAEQQTMARKLLERSAGGLLEVGQAVVRDVDNRVSGVAMDLIFSPLKRAAQTNATLVPYDKAHPVPADPRDWELDPEVLLAVRRQVSAAVEGADRYDDGSYDDEDYRDYFDDPDDPDDPDESPDRADDAVPADPGQTP